MLPNLRGLDRRPQPQKYSAALTFGDRAIITLEIEQVGVLFTKLTVKSVAFTETDDQEIRNCIEAIRRLGNMLTEVVNKTED
jgi:hypothetical protein